MRAKLVEYNFQRGIDPKAAMGIGLRVQILNYIKENFPRILNKDDIYFHILTKETYKEIKRNVCPSLPIKQFKQILIELDFGIPFSRDKLIGRISDEQGIVTRNKNIPVVINGPWIILSYKSRCYYKGECVGGNWNVKNLETGEIPDHWVISPDDINTKKYRLPTEKEKIKYNL